MTSIKKIALSFNDFGGLLSGRLARIYDMESGASVEYHRAARLFVMDGETGRHTLAADATSHERLNAHWLGYAESNRNARAARLGAK